MSGTVREVLALLGVLASCKGAGHATRIAPSEVVVEIVVTPMSAVLRAPGRSPTEVAMPEATRGRDELSRALAGLGVEASHARLALVVERGAPEPAIAAVMDVARDAGFRDLALTIRGGE